MMQQIFHKIRKNILNKYLVAFVLFAVWITFFEEADYRLLDQRENKQKLVQLKEQKVFYRDKIKSDQRKLSELQTNDETLEKFAREQFQMKKENEDVYVIVEEK